MKYPIYHKYLNGCNEIAFYFLKEPKNGEMVYAHLAEYKDGRDVHAGEQIICGNCGANIKMLKESGVG